MFCVGDCCTATCVKKGFDDCSDGNTYCVDERYRYDCDFGDLSETDRGDGYCDLQLNTVYCDYDGGDCCVSTCVSGFYTCSKSEDDFPNCQEPNSDGFTLAPSLFPLL
ncbi:unnamed protein product, partial [Pylaiella littoralis]